MIKARVFVTLKGGILDPQGRAIERSLANIGFENVSSARQGKIIDLELNADDRDAAHLQVTNMCEKLLVNQVIENFEVELL